MLELNYNKKEWTLLKRNKGIPQNGFWHLQAQRKYNHFYRQKDSLVQDNLMQEPNELVA
jgi:hypothetical protein